MIKRLITLFLLFSTIHLPAAEEETISPPLALERHLRPGPADAPTPVNISVYVIDILEIDDVRRSITLDYALLQTWNDPRLADQNRSASPSKATLTIDDIWHPQISRLNLKANTLREPLISIDEQGNVAYRQRFIDTFTTPFDLRRFPFDKQTVALKFISALYGSNHIELIWNKDRSGHLGDFSIPGWTFSDARYQESAQTVKSLNRDFTGMDLQILLERNSGFYIWKVIIPLSFIAFMAWTVFWIDPDEIGAQIAISTASVITLIAFQFSLSELLPKISYLTEIDLCALGTSFLVFLALGESILTARLAKVDRLDLAQRIDRWMRWLYPTSFVGLLLFVTF